jgi:hypothetical protein
LFAPSRARSVFRHAARFRPNKPRCFFAFPDDTQAACAEQ